LRHAVFIEDLFRVFAGIEIAPPPVLDGPVIPQRSKDFTFMHMRTSRLLMALTVASAIIGSGSASAAPVTFDFAGAQGGAMGEGTVGNTRTFTAGGITLNVTAWGYTYDIAPGTNNALGKASLGRWSTGLGSCNTTEMPCSSPSHQVDNVGVDDWVLFVFSEAIDITSVRIDPYGNYDRDVSYYVGNVSAPLNLTGVNYAGLGGLGFSSLNNSESTASDAYRDVSIAGGYVNALLVGGYANSDQDDYFKIKSVAGQTRVPEPSTLLLLFVGAGAIAFSRSRRMASAVVVSVRI
jgi:hypothetical protein